MFHPPFHGFFDFGGEAKHPHSFFHLVHRKGIKFLFPFMQQSVAVLPNAVGILLLLVRNAAPGGQPLQEIPGARVCSLNLIPI
jgi:hypothetical protein